MQNITWKFYLRTIIGWFIGFYFLTFCIAYYYMHRNQNIALTITLFLIYLIIVLAGVVRMVSKLPMQVIMLLAPTAPLAALFTVVSLIPILQVLQ